ncbi:MAG: MopE-related protein, partial [Myxococcota bacterium]|nr:MopE-related protein [Myxococcota bacterium]
MECGAEAGPAAAADACDGFDDDCDGATDEGFVGVGDPCVVGLGLCQRTGVRHCSDDGASVECGADAGVPAVAERCDGFDDDCDGAIDEGFVGLRTPCAEGVGSCERDGVWVCGADGQGLTCNAQAGQPVDETCNGLDDDCDGAADDDDEDVEDTESWYQDGDQDGYGAPDIRVDACTQPSGHVDNDEDCDDEEATTYPGATEQCDGLDNDCDDEIDDGMGSAWYADLDGDGYGDPDTSE